MTSTITRTDIHRPSAPEFDPADYEFVCVFDARPEFPSEQAWAMELRRRLLADGWKFSGVHGGTGRCDHCGAVLRYSALMQHLPTRTLIYVGETCLGNRFEMTKSEFDKARRQGSLDRERKARLVRFEAACEECPALVYASYADNIAQATPGAFSDWNINIQRDIVTKVRQYGDISPKQAALLERLVAELDEQLTKHQARAAAQAENGPAPVGQQTIEGEVTSTDVRENAYGMRRVMTVRLDNGARVWGTIPRVLIDTVRDAGTLMGTRVTFTATFEHSDDETFAFFKKPLRARVV
jgi:hypothetical protein